MIIKFRTEQAEFIANILHDWHHDSLAERFEKPVRHSFMSKQGFVLFKALVTELEVQLIVEALEEELDEVESGIEEEDQGERIEMLEWDLEIVSTTIASLKSQLKGGEPVEPEKE